MNDSPFAQELAQYSYAEQARKDILHVVELRFGRDLLQEMTDDVFASQLKCNVIGNVIQRKIVTTQLV